MTSEPFHVEGIDVNEPPHEDGHPAPVLGTAFLVFLNPEGHWMATPQIHLAAEMQLSRMATPDDLYSGVCMIKKDIETWEAATKATQLQQQAMRQTIEAAQNQRIQEATGQGGAVDLSQLRKS